MGKDARAKRTFREEWRKDKKLSGWISSRDGGTTAHCKYCNCNIRPHYSDLLKHAETKKHRECAVIPSSQQKLPQLLASSSRTYYEKARRELRIALYTAVHTSINAVDELGEILHSEFNDFDLHRTKCTAIITNVLFPYFTENVDKQLNGSSYSLMVDESTDVSTTKQLCMVVRFLSLEENRIATTLLDLVELSDGTAETLHDTVLKTLDKHGLSIKNCLGLCTDGANAMCGKHNSLFSRLSEDNKDLILIKCSCHSLDLVASKSMEAIPSAVEHLVRETYNYFAHSSCRQDAYKRLYASMTVEDESANPPPKILSLSQTRWLAIADSIEIILAQYQSLEEFFEKAEDRSYNVRILREMYRDRKKYVYLVFLASVLRNVRRVNKMFQTNTTDPLVVFQELENLYLEILRRILNPSVLRHNTTASLLSLDLAKMKSIFLQPEVVDLGDVFREEISLVPIEDQRASPQECPEKCPGAIASSAAY
ncbi:zinc finger protein 862-like [Dermacentor andersoni]|uniref:zinc finger protein 862-like n=1 Tax=Dermacentor andersoni TaxID=34620 RepID=UPI003B3A41AC